MYVGEQVMRCDSIRIFIHSLKWQRRQIKSVSCMYVVPGSRQNKILIKHLNYTLVYDN